MLERPPIDHVLEGSRSMKHAAPKVRPASAAPGATRLRPDIQGLRAVAVLAVVADHLLGWPVGGFVGVDVFFVVSGFLITSLLLREFTRTGTISFTGFYRRRIRRLVPAATLVIVVTILAAALVLPRERGLSTLFDGLFAFLFTANWRFAIQGTDYFEAGLPPSPLQHYWSLSVEEQFYLVWPWLLVALLLVLVRVGVAARARGWVVVGTAAAITVLSFGWALAQTSGDQQFAYFSTLTRAWELGVGATVAAFTVASTRRLPGAWAAVLGWAGLVGIVVSIFVITPTGGFPAPSGALPVLSTAAVIVAGLAPGAGYDRAMFPLTNRVSTYIGDISYSIYLWHFPVVVLAAAFLPEGSKRYLAVCLVAIAILSIAGYHLVEDPVRRSSWLARRSTGERRGRRGIVVAVACAAVLAVTATTTAIALSRPAERTEISNVANTDCIGAAYLANAGDCGPDDLTGDVVPSVDGLSDDEGEAFSCWRPEGGELKTCHYGATDGEALRVALVGDSHAAMLMPALAPRVEELGWSLDTYLGYGCQWLTPADLSDCSGVIQEASGLLADPAQPYDLIITSAARWSTSSYDDASTRYENAWRAATDLGTTVVAVADAPTVSEEALACVSRVGFDPTTQDCSTPLGEATEPADPLRDAADAAGAELVSLDDLFCVEDGCPAVVGGVIVYRDTVGHVTATYMRTLAPYLVERIEAALP